MSSTTTAVGLPPRVPPTAAFSCHKCRGKVRTNELLPSNTLYVCGCLLTTSLQHSHSPHNQVSTLTPRVSHSSHCTSASAPILSAGCVFPDKCACDSTLETTRTVYEELASRINKGGLQVTLNAAGCHSPSPAFIPTPSLFFSGCTLSTRSPHVLL